MKAICDAGGCGKAVTVDIARGQWYANHRHPQGGTCPNSITRVKVHNLVHPCVDCQALPVSLAQILPGQPEAQRPPRPRAATGKPPRCFRHRQLHLKALKAARNGRARERARGFPEADRAELWAAQGERCGICAVPLNVERKAPELDHDHDRAIGHDHPDDQVCRACARGLLCRTCNLHVVGRLNRAALMRALRWHEINTAVDLGWWDEQRVEMTS